MNTLATTKEAIAPERHRFQSVRMILDKDPGHENMSIRISCGDPKAIVSPSSPASGIFVHDGGIIPDVARIFQDFDPPACQPILDFDL